MTRCQYVPSLLSLTSTHFYLALLSRGSSATRTGWKRKTLSLAITDEFYTFDLTVKRAKKENMQKFNFKVKILIVRIAFYSDL